MNSSFFCVRPLLISETKKHTTELRAAFLIVFVSGGGLQNVHQTPSIPQHAGIGLKCCRCIARGSTIVLGSVSVHRARFSLTPPCVTEDFPLNTAAPGYNKKACNKITAFLPACHCPLPRCLVSSPATQESHGSCSCFRLATSRSPPS